MREEASALQTTCSECQPAQTMDEAFTAHLAEDWRIPYLEYLQNGILPAGLRETYKLRRLALRYFTEGNILFRKGFNGEPLRCLSNAEAQKALQEVHAGECRERQGKKKLYRQLLGMGYYWPAMAKDASTYVCSCHTCQLQKSPS
ncbi:uncharacterized protein LOC112091411 [Morus notabilis]|uniref:uncharacterized protein LOC112091411 n=1 Tax=Morus notabilis TaxID=981085 RepID=UPI000CED36A5|nr:uncharacterized protein LOC112091411 [Morus notabilis]